MGFDETVDRVNEVCLAVFGQTLTLTRALTADSLPIVGILEEGIEPEDRPPGDGSVYAGFWTAASSADPPAETGDEISTATTVYKIVRIQQDAGSGFRMLLRKDRTV